MSTAATKSSIVAGGSALTSWCAPVRQRERRIHRQLTEPDRRHGRKGVDLRAEPDQVAQQVAAVGCLPDERAHHDGEGSSAQGLGDLGQGWKFIKAVQVLDEIPGVGPTAAQA